MSRRKLDAGCFWCDMTDGSDPFTYWMSIVEADHYGKFHPVTSVRLGVDQSFEFQEDGRALRAVLTRIAKMEDIPEILDYKKIP
tara:strand:- start:2911 stop:3162 length:252 start_codon:yes stop_codon:yes gene_type:complete